jgi:hypothetical protein
MNRIKAVILALVMLFSAIGLAQTVVPILAARTPPGGGTPGSSGCDQVIPNGNYFAINSPFARLCGGGDHPSDNPGEVRAENRTANWTTSTTT